MEKQPRAHQASAHDPCPQGGACLCGQETKSTEEPGTSWREAPSRNPGSAPAFHAGQGSALTPAPPLTLALSTPPARLAGRTASPQNRSAGAPQAGPWRWRWRPFPAPSTPGRQRQALRASEAGAGATPRGRRGCGRTAGTAPTCCWEPWAPSVRRSRSAPCPASSRTDQAWLSNVVQSALTEHREARASKARPEIYPRPSPSGDRLLTRSVSPAKIK